jgi:hypothetical protein
MESSLLSDARTATCDNRGIAVGRAWGEAKGLVKCYICGTEFNEEHGSCPACGTQYSVDLKKALDDPVGRYRGLRTDGFETPPQPERKQDPSYAASLLTEGLEKARAGDYQAAEPLFREAHVWDEENPEILFYWGSSLFRLGRYLEAKSHWEKACRLAPENDKYRRWLQKVDDLLSQDF